PWREIARLGAQICAGLGHAHRRGIVHRDLKPANVWLSAEGTVKIGDFGLALSLDRSRMTSDGAVVGTVAYMAPEQALGGPTGSRRDVYSAGVLLYELLAGRLPFIADSPIAVIYQHVHATPVVPSVHSPEIPEVFEDLVLRLMAKTPGERAVDAASVESVLT